MDNNFWQRIKMRIAFLTATLLLAIDARSDARLIGRHNYHEGPNCFNAALYAKGFVKNLVYIDSAEFQFYTENYCQKTVAAKPLDLVTVVRENTFEHAALYLGNDEIFEKQSTRGIYNKFSNPADATESQYRKIPRLSSPYFSTELEDRTFEAYSCQTPTSVVASLNNLCSNEDFHRTVSEIRKKIERISFSPEKNYDPNLLPIDETHRFIQIISQLDGKDDCSVYAFSIAISTSFNLWHLGHEQESIEELTRVGEALKNSLKLLKSKIALNNQSPVASKVLSEAHWLK